MRTALRGGRFVVQTVVVIGLLGGLLVRPARAQTADAYYVMSLVNSTRASAGAPPVTLDGTLSAVAQTWALTMATAGTITHNPALGAQLSGWTALAENVGMGSSIDVVHQVMVNSAIHFANMTDARYTTAGAGAVAAGGHVFVAQVFMQGHAAPPPPPPPPPPPSPPEPEPEPWPEPAFEPAPEPEPFVAPSPPAPASAPDPAPAPGPTPLPIPAPAPPVEPSDWLALVFEQLQALDRGFG